MFFYQLERLLLNCGAHIVGGRSDLNANWRSTNCRLQPHFANRRSDAVNDENKPVNHWPPSFPFTLSVASTKAQILQGKQLANVTTKPLSEAYGSSSYSVSPSTTLRTPLLNTLPFAHYSRDKNKFFECTEWNDSCSLKSATVPSAVSSLFSLQDFKGIQKLLSTYRWINK